jgi:hypothetical protein
MDLAREADDFDVEAYAITLNEGALGLDNEPDVAVDAARTLKEAGFLRVQDNANLQVVVLIRGKSAKAYAVRSSILDWKPDNYGNYGPATNKRANGVPSDKRQTPGPQRQVAPSFFSNTEPLGSRTRAVSLKASAPRRQVSLRRPRRGLARALA